MLTTKEEQKVLIKEKHDLIKKLDKKEISQEDYDTIMADIEKRLNEHNSSIINNKTEDKKMSEENVEQPTEEVVEEVKEVPKEAKPKKEKKVSRTKMIVEALQDDSIKDINAAMAAVAEKTNSDLNDPTVKKNIKQHINWFIQAVKSEKSKKKYKELYTWDAEAYKLTAK